VAIFVGLRLLQSVGTIQDYGNWATDFPRSPTRMPSTEPVLSSARAGAMQRAARTNAT